MACTQQSITSQQIKQLLYSWREVKAAQAGLSPEHPLYCARHSIILHDIFIDAIAENAARIHSVNDIKHFAYYWKFIDAYGDDLFETVKSFLASPKRCLGAETDAREAYGCGAKRLRTVA